MQEASGEVPAALKSRPRLQEYERYYLQLFSDLTGSRQQGDAVGNIPFDQFRGWCEFWGVQGLSSRERLYKYLRKMDEAYVSFALERRKQDMERARSSPRR